MGFGNQPGGGGEYEVLIQILLLFQPTNVTNKKIYSDIYAHK